MRNLNIHSINLLIGIVIGCIALALFAITIDLFALDSLRRPAVCILDSALSSLDAALFWLQHPTAKGGV